MITSESPATQRRSFFCGVNFGLPGGFATAGFGVALLAGFGFVLVGGITIATSISSASSRPATLCTNCRGRSSWSAPLTPARPPVRASATSRSVPGCLLNDALCMPGAFSSAPKSRASTATTSPLPADEYRRPSSVRFRRRPSGFSDVATSCRSGVGRARRGRSDDAARRCRLSRRSASAGCCAGATGSGASSHPCSGLARERRQDVLCRLPDGRQLGEIGWVVGCH